MAESPARNTGELANGWSLGPAREPLPAGRIASPVQIQGYPDDLEVAEHLAVSFLLDLVDETVHRLGDARESCCEATRRRTGTASPHSPRR